MYNDLTFTTREVEPPKHAYLRVIQNTLDDRQGSLMLGEQSLLIKDSV